VGGGGGGGGGGVHPQRNDPVGLKLRAVGRAVGLKIMRLFTCSALRSKLNIFETQDRLSGILNYKFFSCYSIGFFKTFISCTVLSVTEH
jgi:hypothetical protein